MSMSMFDCVCLCAPPSCWQLALGVSVADQAPTGQAPTGDQDPTRPRSSTGQAPTGHSCTTSRPTTQRPTTQRPTEARAPCCERYKRAGASITQREAQAAGDTLRLVPFLTLTLTLTAALHSTLTSALNLTPPMIYL